MSATKVYPWRQVASDISGLDDAALDELMESQRKRVLDPFGEDQYGRNLLQRAARADVGEVLFKALNDGSLKAYCPAGIPIKVEQIQALEITLPGVCVYPEHVNKLLSDQGYIDVWEPGKAEQNNLLPNSSKHETTGQRRDRWLKWIEEEQVSGKRGALARVHRRELARNPKADRSYIGRQIKLAQEMRSAGMAESATAHEPKAHSPFGSRVKK